MSIGIHLAKMGYLDPNRQVERLDARRYGSAVKLPEVYRVYLEDWIDVPALMVGVRLVQLLAGNDVILRFMKK